MSTFEQWEAVRAAVRRYPTKHLEMLADALRMELRWRSFCNDTKPEAASLARDLTSTVALRVAADELPTEDLPGGQP